MTPTARFALSTAVRVVDRIHRHAADRRPDPPPTSGTGFAEHDVLVVEIAYLPDRCVAFLAHDPHLTRRKLQLDVIALLGHDLRIRASGSNNLPALTVDHLDIVNGRSQRNALQRQRVAGLDIRLRTGFQLIAHLQPMRRQDVPFLTISVVQQGNTRGAVRIILDRRHLRRDIELVPFEIDLPVRTLVPATLVPDGHSAFVVPAARPLKRLEERLLGTLFREPRIIGDRAISQRRCYMIELLNRHRVSSFLFRGPRGSFGVAFAALRPLLHSKQHQRLR